MKNSILFAGLAVFLGTSCGVSGEPEINKPPVETDELTDEEQAALEKAAADATDALNQAATNAADLADIADRVSALETDVSDLKSRMTAAEDTLTAYGTRLDSVEDDIEALQSAVVNDEDVVVDDPEAAGFTIAANVDNVEEGLANVNNRLNSQSDDIAANASSLETAYNNSLAALNTANTINQTIPGLMLDLDEALATVATYNELLLEYENMQYLDLAKSRYGDDSFADYLADAIATGVVTGGEATITATTVTVEHESEETYEDDAGIPESDAILPGEGFETVQEALESLYTAIDNVYEGGDPIPGSSVGVTGDHGYTDAQGAIDGLYQHINDNHTTLLAQISALGGDLNEIDFSASGVTVDATNLASTGYDNVQAALESLYTWNASLQDEVDVYASDIALNELWIENIINGLDTTANAWVVDQSINAANGVLATVAANGYTSMNQWATAIAEGVLQAAIDNANSSLNFHLAGLDVGSSGPHILGVSGNNDDGKWQYDGQAGVRAATASCQDTFADENNVHMCTLEEVHAAISNGAYDNGNSINAVEVWAVGATQRPSVLGINNGSYHNDSLGTTCQNLLYNSGHVAVGTTMKVMLDYLSNGGQNAGNVTGDVVQVRHQVSCASSFRVLCCQ